MKPLVVITGPTASGKTNLSLLLAKKIGSQIICADSMQIYKYMDIGTAKIRSQERKIIKHYMIDEVEPDEDFSVAQYQAKVKKYLDIVYSNNSVPILCGGTGFYINAILYDNDFFNEHKDLSLRNELYNLTNKQLQEKLFEIDFESAKSIHSNDKKRMVRAIEFFYQNGQKISHHNSLQKKNAINYNTLFIILNLPRQILYKKIEERVDKMIEVGLVDEVEKLLDMGYDKNLNSMQAIGYKEIIMYLQKQISLDEAIKLIKKNTRHYAKRQLTWFRHQTNGIWIEKNDFVNENEISDYVFELYRKKFEV